MSKSPLVNPNKFANYEENGQNLVQCIYLFIIKLSEIIYEVAYGSNFVHKFLIYLNLYLSITLYSSEKIFP